jgi:thiol:disulfide interchange protein DsbD
MKSTISWTKMIRRTMYAPAASAGFVLAFSALCFAQGNVNPLTIAQPERIAAKAGSTAEIKLNAQLRTGYHANSNTPSDEYLIPMRLTWSTSPLEVAEVVYPKAQMEKYSFSDKPLSVYTGDFEVVTKFKIPSSATPGQAVLTGKLRYQACTDRMCLPPKTVEVTLPVDITK